MNEFHSVQLHSRLWYTTERVEWIEMQTKLTFWADNVWCSSITSIWDFVSMLYDFIDAGMMWGQEWSRVMGEMQWN